MANVTRRDVLGIAATGAFALATPALADAPAPFSVNEVVDDGHRFFGDLSRGLADVVQEATSRWGCLLYTSPSPRDRTRSRMPSSA